jgi:hypothetical protein
MGAIKENQVFVLGFLLLITIALCIVIVIMSGKIYKNFYVKKFSFTGICEGDGTLNVIISNKSLNDMTVTALGISCGLTFYDYMKEYRAQNGIAEGAKVVIPARSSLELHLNVEDCEKEVLTSLTVPPKKLAAYVIDSYGGLCKSKIGAVAKRFQSDYVQAEKQRKEARVLASKKDKAEQIQARVDDLTVKRLRDEKLSFFEARYLHKHSSAMKK